MVAEPCLDCYRGFPCDEHPTNIYTLTLAEAATRLGVSPVTLRIQVRKGRLLAFKRGRDWFVSTSEVDRYRDEVQGK